MSAALIVWDFDGVLNANIRDGRFVWADTLKADLGIDPKAFAHDLFGTGVIAEVMRGRIDLLAHVSGWLKAKGHEIPGPAFLDYWFARDTRPDAQVLDWLKAHPGRRVIGTNNEEHRTRYIEQDLGYAAHVERVFSSGRMGAAKPDPGFFAQIERWADLPPGEMMLIDDVAGNVAAAKARGWQGFHFTDASRVRLPEILGLA